MKMTPLDVRQKRFEVGFRGYARKEVEGFLELTASEFEEVVRDNIALKEEAKRLQGRLEQYVEREKMLQETMVTAQRISEDIKLQARKEADIAVAQGELQAEKIIAAANNRLVELVKDIGELKRQKVQFHSQVESVIESHRKLLETFKTDQTELAYLIKKAEH